MVKTLGARFVDCQSPNGSSVRTHGAASSASKHASFPLSRSDGAEESEEARNVAVEEVDGQDAKAIGRLSENDCD
jgi:hypothetical protein